MLHFKKETWLPASPQQAFAWHARPGAFDSLSPPWQRFEVLERPEALENGTRLVFRLFKGPFRIRWVAEHRDVIPGRQFRDVQVAGPFAAWNHLHAFEPRRGGCLLRDEIEYAPPLGFIGRWLGGPLISRDLERVFAYRHGVTYSALESS